jgi:formate hydrogenlyase subunit 6/NADH:ubiquinone oxidoreductase subunit I
MFGTEIRCQNFCPTFARAQAETLRERRQNDERTFGMSAAKRTTMSKMNRERELKEKRALKKERKEQKKLAAAAAPIEAEGLAAPPPA